MPKKLTLLKVLQETRNWIFFPLDLEYFGAMRTKLSHLASLLLTPLLLLSQPTLGDGRTAKERVQAILQGELSYVLTPTVYFLPTMVQDLSLCRFSSQKMMDPDGKVLVTVCPEQHDQCLLQGTCKIVKGKESITLHFNSRAKGVAFFNQVQLDECPFGFGVRESLCLDPLEDL